MLPQEIDTVLMGSLIKVSCWERTNLTLDGPPLSGFPSHHIISPSGVRDCHDAIGHKENQPSVLTKG